MPRRNNRFYDLLEVGPDVTPRGLEISWRRLCARLELRANEDEIAHRLDEARLAWTVLSDPKRRMLYDAFGEASVAPDFELPLAAPSPLPLPPGPVAEVEHATKSKKKKKKKKKSKKKKPVAEPVRSGPIEVWISFRRACAGGVCEASVAGNLVEVPIPAGVYSGTIIEVDEHIFLVRVDEDDVFTRKGLDLHMNLTIDERDAHQGTAVVVPTLGRHVKVHIPPESQAGQKLRLKGKGIQTEDEVGDLYATLYVRKHGTQHVAGYEPGEKRQS